MSAAFCARAASVSARKSRRMTCSVSSIAAATRCEPRIRSEGKLLTADWATAIAQAALQLKQFSGHEIAIVASGRMTNEELWLTLQLAKILGVELIDIVPRTGPGDDILLSTDRNPNTNGAHLILHLNSGPGASLPAIAEAVNSGRLKDRKSVV